ncbi:MAG: hypothetical protein RLZ77_167 [Bacteroidota bacterium]|jgi:hypothetical protein
MILVSYAGLLSDPELGDVAQIPSSSAERFLVGKGTSVSNLFDDIERLVEF